MIQYISAKRCQKLNEIGYFFVCKTVISACLNSNHILKYSLNKDFKKGKSTYAEVLHLYTSGQYDSSSLRKPVIRVIPVNFGTIVFTFISAQHHTTVYTQYTCTWDRPSDRPSLCPSDN
jgi:hypothetical protein